VHENIMQKDTGFGRNEETWDATRCHGMLGLCEVIQDAADDTGCHCTCRTYLAKRETQALRQGWALRRSEVGPKTRDRTMDGGIRTSARRNRG